MIALVSKEETTILFASANPWQVLLPEPKQIAFPSMTLN